MLQQLPYIAHLHVPSLSRISNSCNSRALPTLEGRGCEPVTLQPMRLPRPDSYAARIDAQASSTMRETSSSPSPGSRSVILMSFNGPSGLGSNTVSCALMYAGQTTLSKYSGGSTQTPPVSASFSSACQLNGLRLHSMVVQFNRNSWRDERIDG